MKCTECRFNVDGRCTIQLPPFIRVLDTQRAILDGEGCDLGQPVTEVTI